MTISVVIPAYNAARTIVQALESCVQQSCPPHEIIVVDDASNDDTISVVEQFPYPVKIISVATNKGPSHARNAGWAAATSEVIAFLDADDTWHPDKLLIIDNVFKTNEEVLYLGHPYTLHDFEPVEHYIAPTQTGYTSILISNPFQSSCIVVRKSLQEKFAESMRYCEDQEFSMRIAYDYGCFSIPYALTRLNRPQLTEGGASANLWKMRKGELRAYSSVWKQNPLFVVLIPLLLLFSLAKFGWKWMRMKRK